jgi:hypothetical protein
MRHVLRVLTLAAAATLTAYAVLWLVAGLWDTPARASAIDTPQGDDDLYSTPLREFVYRLPAFCAPARTQRNLIFIGGSVARAYRPEIIAPMVSGWTVSDVSLDFANMTEIRQALTLMRDCIGLGGLRDSTIVLAINFLQFSPNSRIWKTPYTYLELDLLRHGLFDGEQGAVAPVLSWRWLPFAVSAMRPVLAAYGLAYRINLDLEDVLLHWAGARGRPDPDHAQEIRGLITHFDGTGRHALQEQIAELDRFTTDVRAAGARLIILDMPVQGWLRDSMPQFHTYRNWIADYAQRHGTPYIDHAFAGTDDDFRDGFHANAAGERHWSALAAGALEPLLTPR